MSKTAQKTMSVSKIKIGLALAFLGAAALAASAAGGTMAKPDLVIESIKYLAKGGFSKEDTVLVYFKNVGNAQVIGKYHLLLTSQPSIDLAQKITTLSSDEIFSLPLKPGQMRQAVFSIKKIYEEEVVGNKLKIFIDYKQDDPDGNILELNENNNTYTISFDRLSLDYEISFFPTNTPKKYLDPDDIYPEPSGIKYPDSNALKDRKADQKPDGVYPDPDHLPSKPRG